MPDSNQPFISLSPEFLVGVEVIDRQHREIVSFLNEVYEDITKEGFAGSHLGLVTRFVNLIASHFMTEEQLLRVQMFPDYLRHKSTHEGLMFNLKHYREQVARGEGKITRAYAELMKLWFLDHITEFDLKYARFIAEKRHKGGDAPKQDSAPPTPSANAGTPKTEAGEAPKQDSPVPPPGANAGTPKTE